MNYGDDYELSRRPETDEEYSTAKGWRLSMMNAPTNGGYHELFINTGGTEIYVDHNKNRPYLVENRAARKQYI